MASVRLAEDRFDPYEILSEHRHAGELATKTGAIDVFIGQMRDHNEGASVCELYLEHYPGMTERALGEVLAEACQRWTLLDALIVHRVGRVLPGETIVLVAVWASRRAAAFEACRFVVEALKHTAPFWKQETLNDGRRRWVETNTPG